MPSDQIDGDETKHPPNPPLPRDVFEDLSGAREQWGFEWPEWYAILAALDVPERVLLAARTADGLRDVHEAAREAHAAADAPTGTAAQPAAPESAPGGANGPGAHPAAGGAERAHDRPEADAAATPGGGPHDDAAAADGGVADATTGGSWDDGLREEVAHAAEDIVSGLKKHSADTVTADFVRNYVLSDHDDVSEQEVKAALTDHDKVTPPDQPDGEWQWSS